MVTIEFIFPIEKDAHKFRNNIGDFFNGSFLTESENDQFILGPVKKIKDKSRDVWSFKLILRKDKNDVDIDEKYLKISGGTLDIMNGNRRGWVFA